MEQTTTSQQTQTTTHTTTGTQTTSQGGTTTTQISTTTTSQTETTTTTQTQTGISMCTVQPPSNLKELNDGVLEVLAGVFGPNNMACNVAAIQNGAYNEDFTVTNLDPSQINNYLTQISKGLETKGWANVTIAANPAQLGIYAQTTDHSIELIILMQIQGNMGNIAIQIGPS
ncbi:MAG: hypothetical protein F7B60_00860 [Desulfurococcales archaeon]|nr:hypothetical protein [Desulfurococcales archaeon]